MTAVRPDLDLLATDKKAHSTMTQLHVATSGSDTSPGSASEPFRTINKAARVAEPGPDARAQVRPLGVPPRPRAGLR